MYFQDLISYMYIKIGWRGRVWKNIRISERLIQVLHSSLDFSSEPFFNLRMPTTTAGTVQASAWTHMRCDAWAECIPISR